MKLLNQLTCLLVIAAVSNAWAEDAKPKPTVKIVNETKIFALDKSKIVHENDSPSMRISPDGKTLLYVERIAKANENARHAYRLRIRDIKTGKDTAMPGASCTEEDFLTAYVSSTCPFDATGKNLVIPICKSQDDGKPLDIPKGTMQLGIYEIATGKTKKLALTAPVIFPSYDATGKNLIVLEMFAKDSGGPDINASKIAISPVDKIEFREIGVKGLPRTPCPTGDILPITLLPNWDEARMAPNFDTIIYDTKTNKKLTAPKISSGDDPTKDQPQWTSDGRYLYYINNEIDKTPEGATRHKQLMGVWDRKKCAEVSLAEGLIPVGPIPGKNGMIVKSSKGYKYSIHDPSTGKTTPIFDGKRKIESITGRFMVCLKEDAKGSTSVYRTEIK